MDVIFHRNCLDGSYSAYLLYLFCKTLPKQTLNLLQQHIKSHTSNQLKILHSQKILVNQCPSITQQFFHKKSQIPFHGVSMYAGDLFPIVPSTPDSILFFVDITPSTKQLMINFSKQYKYIIIIDHHATFQKCLDTIIQQKLANVFYLWNKQKCACQLVQQYLFNSFGFMKNLPQIYQKQLYKQIQYVGKNDLKINQNQISKQFVLGFYYFQIQMSHHNPLLFKRIWGLNMEILMNKGQIIYQNHIRALIYAVQNCDIYQIVKSKFKGYIFLAIQMSDRQLVSDLGSLLSYLSVRYNKFQNLAMIYNKSQGQFRISFRSYQFLQQPKALQVSQFYGGGGHLCAAGCFIQKNIFNQNFKNQGKLKPRLKITKQQIQNILFSKGVQ